MRTAIVDAAVTSELRRSVLRPAWPTGSVMHGDEDPRSLHFALLADDEDVVSACVLVPRAYPCDAELQPSWQLRGMVTPARLRGQGNGGRLLAGVLAEMTERRAVILWCEARVAAMTFYARHGFATVGDEFVNAETGISHRVMWRRLDDL